MGAPRRRPSAAPRERVRLTVRGDVQGVGFRPFVYRAARAFGIAGWVANTAAGVTIEAEGAADRSPVSSRHPARTAAAGARRRGRGRWRWRRAAATASRSGRARSPARAAPPFSPISRPAPTACARSSIRATAATAIPSPTAPIAARATPSSKTCPTTAPAPRCAASRCARRAGRNTRIRRTGAFTPSRTPARPAGRSSRCGMRAGGQLAVRDAALLAAAAAIRERRRSSR